ncbi:MAG: amidase domain-containing protein [Aeromicrobium sp.]|uniref:amidase domain-containing protein n=1 Tax=Aeromicrobium sp. TaxID=1871063 RepID=UPI0039E3892E
MISAINGKAIRLLVTALLVSGSFLVGVALASPSVASGYNGANAAAYAQKYACNGKSCGNSAYKRQTNDCANFVSQAMAAGGSPQWGPAYTYRWYYNKSNHSKSTSWINVGAFRQFMVDGSKRAVYRSVSMGAANSPAARGDVYVYDWGKGNGYSHVSMSTGSGTFINYYDSGKKRNYNQITGGKGDKMAQHTADRDGAPWNWGYHTESNPKVRAKMKTVVLDVK